MCRRTKQKSQVGSEVVEVESAASASFPTPNSKSKHSKGKNATSREQQLHDDTTKDSEVAPAYLPTPSPTPMPAARALPLLICSIGNPGPTYANTLHSAGHTVLTRLAEHIKYPPFRKDRNLGNGLVSSEGGGAWTLWQSTSYMNESGKSVRKAWQEWSRQNLDGKLVIVHDELEKPLGAVTLRTNSGASAKGHNGLKSILSVMCNTPFARIGIGIGRPVSRESDDVARYVLKKMTAAEKGKIEDSVTEVVSKLEQLEKP